MKAYLYLSRLCFICAIIFSVVFFSVLIEHTEELALWITLTLVSVSVINGFVAENLWDKYKQKHNPRQSGFDKVMDAVCSIPVLIAMLPSIIISIIENSCAYDMERRFGFLKKRGFVYRADGFVSYFERKDIILKIAQDYEYSVSIDGKDFIPLYDSDYGTAYERGELKKAMEEYAKASIEDKRNGNTVDTAKYAVRLVKSYIK